MSNRYQMVHDNARKAKAARRQSSWWRGIDSDTWKDLYEVSRLDITPHGDTETDALRNIYYQSRVATGKWRTTLSELEQQVFNLYTLAKRSLGHGYTEADICRHVSQAMRLVTPAQVKAIMRSVEAVQRNLIMLEDAEYEANTVHIEFKKLVKEVMSDEFAKAGKVA